MVITAIDTIIIIMRIIMILTNMSDFLVQL